MLNKTARMFDKDVHNVMCSHRNIREKFRLIFSLIVDFEANKWLISIKEDAIAFEQHFEQIMWCTKSESLKINEK